MLDRTFVHIIQILYAAHFLTKTDCSINIFTRTANQIGEIEMDTSPKKLLDQVADALRVRHYAYRTEQTCIH